MSTTETLHNPQARLLTFETAAANAVRDVPVVEPGSQVGDVRESLAGRRFDSASHVVVCREQRFAGIITIEDLLSAPEDATMEKVMVRSSRRGSIRKLQHGKRSGMENPHSRWSTTMGGSSA